MASEPPIDDDYWEDRDASKKTNALFTNRIFVQPLGDGMVRVSFGETLDEEPSYHTSLVLTTARAIEFGRLLHDVGVTTAKNERTIREIAEALAVKETHSIPVPNPSPPPPPTTLWTAPLERKDGD